MMKTLEVQIVSIRVGRATRLSETLGDCAGLPECYSTLPCGEHSRVRQPTFATIVFWSSDQASSVSIYQSIFFSLCALS